MSLENGEGSAGVRVPDLRRIVSASGDDALAVGAIRRGQDGILMSLRTARAPESASQTRAVLSKLAVTMRLPSGYTPRSRRYPDALENGEGSAGVRVPDPRRFVSLRGDDALAVGAIRRGIDALLMSPEDGEGRPESASQTRAVCPASGDDALGCRGYTPRS